MKIIFLTILISLSFHTFGQDLHGTQRMGDRYTISNTFYNIFTNSTTDPAHLSKLQEILFDNILSKHSIFGAPCDYYEARLDTDPILQEGSVNSEGVTDTQLLIKYKVNSDDKFKNCYDSSEMYVPFSPASNVSASALTVKTCTEIMCECDYATASTCSCGTSESAMKENAFVSAALKKVCKDSTGAAITLESCTLDDTTALNTLRLFHPFYASLPSDLSGLSSEVVEGVEGDENVSLVSFLYAVCIDPTWR